MIRYLKARFWFKTEKSIAADVHKHFLSDATKAYKSFDYDFKQYLARFIRNEYLLWHVSPLTKQWRSGVKVIKDGVDYSKDHPDAVSMRIVHEVEQLLRKL